MSPCVTCSLTEEYCTCDSQTVNFDDLSYTNDQFEVPESLIRQLLWANRNVRDALTAWESICDSDPTGSNVRKAHFWTTCSVQTRTAILDSVTDIPLNDFNRLKQAVEATYDGDLKWEKVHDVWTGEVAENVADSAREDNWVEAVAGIVGLQQGGGLRDHESYTRVVKAHLITEILGDPDAMCLDSARREALEPLFEEMFEDSPRRNPSTPVAQAEYREQDPGMRANPVHPGSKEFLEDRLTRNPREYRAITTEILDRLTEETGMSRRAVSHALFILGSTDGTTAHESLAEMLD